MTRATGQERRRNVPRWVRRAGLLGLALVALLLASLPLFVLPSVDEPEDVRSAPVDAVVVLGGGQGERIATARALLGRLPDPPPELLLSVPHGPPLVACGEVPEHPGVDVGCFVPAPFTTSGEAATVVARAAEQGWERMVVVTSDYHVTRSRLLFDACVTQQAPSLEVLWVAGDTESLTLRGLWHIATEWPSLLATPWDHEEACSGDPAV